MNYFAYTISILCLAVTVMLAQSVNQFSQMSAELGFELHGVALWILQSRGAFPLLLIVVLAISTMICAYLGKKSWVLWLMIITVCTMLVCISMVVLMLYVPFMDALVDNAVMTVKFKN